MKRLWDNDCFVDDNTLTVNMTRLRKKLETVGAGQMVHTQKGLGYLLDAAFIKTEEQRQKDKNGKGQEEGT